MLIIFFSTMIDMDDESINFMLNFNSFFILNPVKFGRSFYLLVLG